MGRDLPVNSGFNVKSILAFFGLVIVLAGFALLMFFAYLVFQIVDAPQSVPIVQYIMDMTEIDGPIVNGKFSVPMDDGSGLSRNADFEIEMSPEMKAIIFLFIGAIALSICVNIVRIIITAGSSMIKAAGPESGIKISAGQKDSSREDHLHYKRALEEERRNARR